MFGIWPTTSDFVKECPACKERVHVRDLRKIPRKAKTQFHITPAAHTACPKCGELVFFTLQNSPLLLVPFVLFGAMVVGPMLVPGLQEVFTSMPGLQRAGELLALVMSGAVMTAAVRRARLKRAH